MLFHTCNPSPVQATRSPAADWDYADKDRVSSVVVCDLTKHGLATGKTWSTTLPTEVRMLRAYFQIMAVYMDQPVPTLQLENLWFSLVRWQFSFMGSRGREDAAACLIPLCNFGQNVLFGSMYLSPYGLPETHPATDALPSRSNDNAVQTGLPQGHDESGKL
jgi:hypothetical protein